MARGSVNLYIGFETGADCCTGLSPQVIGPVSCGFGGGRSLGVVCGALCGTPRLWFLRGLLPCAYPQLRTQRIHLITGHFVSFGQSIACVREWHHPAVDSPMVRTPSAGTAPASCARSSACALELRAMPDSARGQPLYRQAYAAPKFSCSNQHKHRRNNEIRAFEQHSNLSDRHKPPNLAPDRP